MVRLNFLLPMVPKMHSVKRLWRNSKKNCKLISARMLSCDICVIDTDFWLHHWPKSFTSVAYADDLWDLLNVNLGILLQLIWIFLYWSLVLVKCRQKGVIEGVKIWTYRGTLIKIGMSNHGVIKQSTATVKPNLYPLQYILEVNKSGLAK